MSRSGWTVVCQDFADYLGINWVSGTTIYDCISVYPGLTNIGRTGTQSWTGVFDANLTNPESTLLYEAQQNYNPDRGIGVWRKPPDGGIYKSNGAQMVFLSGRPYRWNADDLKANVMYMLENFFEETVEALSVYPPSDPQRLLRLERARPNPGVSSTSLTFYLPEAQTVQLNVIDVTGRKVRRLVDGARTAGSHTVVWDGRDQGGHRAPGGIYWVALHSKAGDRTRQITLLR